MRNKKRSYALIFIFALIASIFGSGFSTQAFSEELTSTKTDVVKKVGFKESIKGSEFFIPYDEKTVRIEKAVSQNNKVGTIDVYDKKTNTIIESYKVEVHAITDGTSLSGFSPLSTNAHFLRDVSKTTTYIAASVTLITRLNMYSYLSFVQINSFVSNNWTTNSGVHILTDKSADTISTTGSWPTNSIQTLGDATLEVAVSVSAQASYEKLGFSVSGSVSGTVYMRKHITINLGYTL